MEAKNFQRNETSRQLSKQNVRTTDFKTEVPCLFSFSQLAPLVIEYNSLNLAFFSGGGLRMCPVTSTVQLLMEHFLSFFSFSVFRVHHESSSLKFLSENDLQSSFFGIFLTTPKHRVLVTPSKIIINSIFTEFLCKKVLPTAFNTERLD
jgi:hypothetical protein